MINKLSEWNKPFGKYKNGKFKFFKIAKVIKWFDSPMRFIPVVTVGARTDIKLTQFSPGSRTHIRIWLDRMYGIVSPNYTAKGNPKWSADMFDKLASEQ